MAKNMQSTRQNQMEVSGGTRWEQSPFEISDRLIAETGAGKRILENIVVRMCAQTTPTDWSDWDAYSDWDRG